MNRFKVAAAKSSPAHPLCWRARIDPQLTPAQRKELDEAMDDFSIPASIIVLVVTEEWKFTQIQKTSVSRHRREACSCHPR